MMMMQDSGQIDAIIMRMARAIVTDKPAASRDADAIIFATRQRPFSRAISPAEICMTCIGRETRPGYEPKNALLHAHSKHSQRRVYLLPSITLTYIRYRSIFTFATL